MLAIPVLSPKPVQRRWIYPTTVFTAIRRETRAIEQAKINKAERDDQEYIEKYVAKIKREAKDRMDALHGWLPDTANFSNDVD